ncbi:MAG: glucosaminidase domain-containing protein, partial [Turicibacter sp.]|nr:glucosaminidase domain-containing protein [Turicibacter sp.]
MYWKRKKIKFIPKLLVSIMLLNYISDFYYIIATANEISSSTENFYDEINENVSDSEYEILKNEEEVSLDFNNEEESVANSFEEPIVDSENKKDDVPGISEANDEGNEVQNEENIDVSIADEDEELVLESEKIEDAILINEASIEIQKRSPGSGLVQFWQVVPEGQQYAEGTTTSAILQNLQCRPNHDLYPINGVSSHTTYVNSCYVDDALYLGEDNDYYYVYVSGYEGKVAKTKSHFYSLDMNGDGKYTSYEIQTVAYYIPDNDLKMAAEEKEFISGELKYADNILDKYSATGIEAISSWSVQSPSFYRNEGGELIHYLTNNVRSANSYSSIIVGPAPSWMNQNVKYYSYDGIYFYNRWQDIQVDGSGAINKSNPFFNYFQYLPVRSKSMYSADIIENYTVSNVGGSNSKLLGTGNYFYNVQDKYGINGVLQYVMGIHESGWGKSNLSIKKNNLFGMNATDNNPYGNGTSFPNVEAGINYHADRYLSWGYTDPISDYRYFGSHIGNKGSGMNVKYASDPFWGEKIAGWYYRFDKSNGNKDYNYYSIGIKQNSTVANIRFSASTSSNVLYQTKNKYSNLTVRNYPVIILGQSNDYYQIKTDTPIINGIAKFNGTYDWETTNGYITNSVINVINHHNYRNPNQASGVKNGWVEIDGYWSYFDAYGNKVTGWQQIKGVQYYFNSKGQMQKGWQIIDGITYYFNSEGHMLKHWQSIEGIWYYFNSKGHMLKGWQQVEGVQYYFNSKGQMQKGWQI